MLKCLKNDFLYTPVYRQALAKEFEIGQQLEHPNICRTIDLEKVDNLGTVVVMEYMTATIWNSSSRKMPSRQNSPVRLQHS